MIFGGFVLAVMVTAGFVIIFYKLPLRIRSFLAKRYLLLDAFLAWATFTALGFAVMGIFAAAMISLFVSLYLWWYKKNKQAGDEEKIRSMKVKRTAPIHVHYAAKLYNHFSERHNANS